MAGSRRTAVTWRSGVSGRSSTGPDEPIERRVESPVALGTRCNRTSCGSDVVRGSPMSRDPSSHGGANQEVKVTPVARCRAIVRGRAWHVPWLLTARMAETHHTASWLPAAAVGAALIARRFARDARSIFKGRSVVITGGSRGLGLLHRPAVRPRGRAHHARGPRRGRARACARRA